MAGRVMCYIIFSVSATDDDSDTRRLLGEQATLHKFNYGSSSSSSDTSARQRREREGWSFDWRQPFDGLMKLAAFWKSRRVVPPNRKVDINSTQPPSRTFCSNTIRYIQYATHTAVLCVCVCYTFRKSIAAVCFSHER